MEDALVLADCLRRADTVECALEAYVRRRRPRVDWVQEQSRAAAQAWVLPSAVRNAALRERGNQMFRDRYRRSCRRRSRFRIQTILWEGLPAMNGVRKR